MSRRLKPHLFSIRVRQIIASIVPAIPTPALSFLAVGVLVAADLRLPADAVTALKTPWMRIAVRVAGSWIASSGLLLLGWSFR